MMESLLKIEEAVESSQPFSEECDHINNPFDLSAILKISKIPVLNKIFCSGVSRICGLPTLEKKYLQIKAGGRKGKSYVQYLTKRLRLRSKVSNQCSGQSIPGSGAMLVMSNHPYGITDGLLLLQHALQYRDDVKVLINKAITQIEEFEDLVIPVNPYGGKVAQRENVAAMRASQKWLEQGHCLIVFPAGEVSHYQPSKKMVCDSKWSAHIARLAKKTDASVLPVFFHGDNGWLFQLAGFISPWLRTLMLGRCFIKTWDKTIHFTVGELIPPKTYRKAKDTDELAKFFRLQSFLLSSDRYYIGVNRATNKNISVNTNPVAVNKEQEVIPEIEKHILANEVSQLPEKNLLLASGELAIYFAEKPQIPNVMLEIGRLREISFRHVGEGTGKSLDIDKYDEYYTHLFIWHPGSQEIVGAYRAAVVTDVLKQYGISGLYSHSLFKFKSDLLDQLAPSVELGRSFVRLEYQRSYAPLLMLWKGIATYLARETDCSVLFGPVSISKDYRNESQKMLMDYLKMNNPFPQYSKKVKPRNPFKLHKRVGWSATEFDGLKDIELVSHLVSKLESDQKGVPILLKQYLKLGGYVLSFNVDEDFNDVLDCMIVVDLPQNSKKTLQRYMGQDLAEAFLLRHSDGQVLQAS